VQIRFPNESAVSEPPVHQPRFLPPLSNVLPVCLALLASTGCSRVDEIEHYQALALKQPEAPRVANPAQEEPAKEDGILAAIVVHAAKAGDQGWFFKLSGPIAAVGAQVDAFEKFVSSVRFVDDVPQYDPPADWQAHGSSAMRHETFSIPGDPPVELTISMLPKNEEDETAFLLANVNRWRGQLGLAPIGPDALAGATRQVSLSEGTATLVSLVGKLKAGGMGPMGPFSGAGNGK